MRKTEAASRFLTMRLKMGPVGDGLEVLPMQLSRKQRLDWLGMVGIVLITVSVILVSVIILKVVEEGFRRALIKDAGLKVYTSDPWPTLHRSSQ